MKNKFRIVTFFIRRRDLQILGSRKYAYTLGNRVQDFWFHWREIKEPDKASIKLHIKRTMQRILGRQEKVVDYLGTFSGKVWDSAIFLVVYHHEAVESELVPKGNLKRFYLNKNSTCKRMLHEVRQLISVRYPELCFRFAEMKNRAEREKLNQIREKVDPHDREKKPNPFSRLRNKNLRQAQKQ